ncbi:hypothetical protein H072_63 [Dactylellina haptotyla CBS 200.50]|uniref:chitinase n=1 Tax=Dactylellina haptotyla (strain CBS 200.50) TaxID=1284197 RepID=S8CE94_DACHA|nr:hypothetical protein H072_63 [Dactylellina haptotyla CBS 200.50]
MFSVRRFTFYVAVAIFLAPLKVAGNDPPPDETIIITADTFISDLNPCPQLCSEVGNNPENWTVYDSVERLTACPETILLDFNVFNPLDSGDTTVKISACTGATTQTTKRREIDDSEMEIIVNNCAETGVWAIHLFMATLGTGDSGKSTEVIDASRKVQTFLRTTENCGSVVNFAYSNKAVLGVYVGGNTQNHAVADVVVEKFIADIQLHGLADTKIAQFCGPDSDYVIGIVANTKGDLFGVQSIVKNWTDSKCVEDPQYHILGWDDVIVKVASSPIITAESPWGTGDFRASSNMRRSYAGMPQALQPRATCSYIKVVSGDSCATLASKCKITGNQFMQYNTKANLCSTLAVGQPVCCSSGTLPDLKPKPNPDGTCASYLVKSGDYCAAIAAGRGLTVANLESFNKQTWGWTGCNNLLAGVKMCLSTGNPPLPAPITNAVCGPQVPGSRAPTSGQTLASLNPCKLNACCNIWGQCGTTAEFCTITRSATGAPGTSAPGTNGCISNCGTDVIKSAAPAQFISVAYYEAWSPQRPCLQMNVDQIDKSQYTHIHYAFAELTTNFQVDISGVQGEWNKFKAMTGIKKILSFGGWSFSTEQDSYPIFRQAVTDANRQTFANNVVAFLIAHNLDGLDFDWEYPGAPDIPNIPPGNPNDGANYLKFLKMVRAQLPSGKSLSIAAPAGFWYLQGFHPLKDFAPVLDYVIYMTYDLHGQWDYGNKWSQPGCYSGNCLRSHINSTETLNALSMITKAGIPSNKVIVGVSSYGRSFKMATTGCTTPMCRYLGPQSRAMPGRCTGTAGYISNAEIDEIARTNPSARKIYDTESTSNILVWNNTEWVAYMDNTNKGGRVGWFKGLRMGGISDWAVDLQAFVARPPPPSPTTTSTQSPWPTPTSGTIPNCIQFAYFRVADTCDTFLARYPTVTKSNLVTWNKSLGSDCSGTENVKGKNICIAYPTPDSGTAPGCRQYAYFRAADTCESFLGRYPSVTRANLIAFNTLLKSDCSGLADIRGHSVCIDAPTPPPGNPPPNPSTPPPGNPPPSPTTTPFTYPTPTSGTDRDCRKFAYWRVADTCDTFLARYPAVSEENLVAWNKLLGPDCHVSADIKGHNVCIEAPPPCNQGFRYNTLEQVQNDLANIPTNFINSYLLWAQSSSLFKAINDYRVLLNGGYDEKFDIYEQNVRLNVLPEFERWVLGHADQYFDCYIPFVPTPRRMDHCPSLRPIRGDWIVEQPCDWVVKNLTMFQNDAAEQAGIAKNWYTFQKILVDEPPPGPCGDECNIYWTGYPVLNDTIRVPDPKDNIGEALDKLRNIAQLLMDIAEYDDADELLAALYASEIPVFMAQQALQSMRDVVETANEIIEANKISFIVGFISAFLWVIPAVGSYSSSLGFQLTGFILERVGNVAIRAFSLYSLITDPTSTVTTIMGYFIGAAARPNIARMANLRLGMNPTEQAALGVFVVERTAYMRGLIYK